MNRVGTHAAQRPSRLMLALAWIMLAASLPLALSGCGSTKVYTAQKTVVYNDALYNASSVKVMSSSIEARLADGQVLDLANADKRQFNDHVSSHGALPVQMVILLDDQNLLYYSRTTDKYSDFDKARKSFTRAKKSLGRFMADKKQTQLRLK